MENDSIFIDTNVWVALFNPGDALHKQARETAVSLNSGTFELVSSNYVLLECFTVIAKKCGIEAAHDFRQYLNRHKTMRIVWIDETMDDMIWRIFSAKENVGISFVDASNLALARSHRLSYLLTFDRALRKAALAESIALFGNTAPARESV